MARISTYLTSTPAGTDLLIGTKDPNSLETKNFSVQSIVDLAAGGGAVTSLTNIGTSGASTLASGVLNIPIYTSITSVQANEIVANTAKTGITAAQASEITTNTAKVGITTPQSTAITDSVKNDTDNNATPKVTNIVTQTSSAPFPPVGGADANTLYIII